jgi:hypothetical protein
VEATSRALGIERGNDNVGQCPGTISWPGFWRGCSPSFYFARHPTLEGLNGEISRDGLPCLQRPYFRTVVLLRQLLVRRESPFSPLTAAECSQSPTGCYEQATKDCRGSSYQILNSESHAGGLFADIIPGPITWHTMSYACGPSDGRLAASRSEERAPPR